MKNRSTKHKIAIVEIFIVIVLVLWLFFPKSFQNAMDYGFDPQQVTAVTAVLSGDEEITVEMDPTAPAFEELMALLESKRYMAQGDGGQSREIKLAYTVYLSFMQGSDSYGLTFTGDDLMDFTGGPNADCRAFRPTEGLPLQQEVLDLLLDQAHIAE